MTELRSGMSVIGLICTFGMLLWIKVSTKLIRCIFKCKIGLFYTANVRVFVFILLICFYGMDYIG